ncbi:Stp1/IreP family PP2C-type Ser/Thr phosphatase [Aquisalibacillus elongatus]|uniref:protein-serine/threonine phosphatase n=1 Tax=Aquisalibacillus elongatus TaxID=485577 RepID=A0A3N5C901_9BACI|nr:Stp1/IreP family PP2C-type Ser/Thr phosphatase [Aquisalibacillus elongatus]RPF56042.1 protein phosphatase [Aquisalibacillus elongatus]
MNACFISDVGKMRKVNEDSGGVFYNESNQMLTVIADGMGGHQAGDIASDLTSKHIQKLWEKTADMTNVDDVKEWLRQTILKTNEYVLSHAENNKECVGMGTTVVATVYLEDDIVVAHVGDSRLYQVNQDSIIQVTEDHSFVQQLVNNGELTEEEAEAHPKKNVLLQALGTETNIKVDVNHVSWKEQDYILSCTDGLSNKLTNEEIHNTLLLEQSLEEKVHHLVSLANEHGGEDNISVVLVQRKEGDDV